MPPMVVPRSRHMQAPYAAMVTRKSFPEACRMPKRMPSRITSSSRAAIRIQNPARGREAAADTTGATRPAAAGSVPGMAGGIEPGVTGGVAARSRLNFRMIA